MKKIIISLITFYQLFIITTINQILGVNKICRFSPTCSEYTKRSIQQYGILQGLKRGMKQFMHCHPFSKQYGNI